MKDQSIKDEKLIELFLARNEDAVALTSGKYGAYCTTVASGILSDPSDVEECVSDTWLGAWNSIPPNIPRILRTYLGRITRNLSLKRWRELTAEKRGGGAVAAVLDELAECVSGSGSAESGVELEELAESINAFLSGLTAERRIIFMRRYWYMEPVDEIARSMGLTESKVKMTLKRVRDGLAEKLRKEGYDI